MAGILSFRNLIETNIEAGMTLYTDHKPALFENSLSNKGQLSAWKLAVVSDLLSIVENLYRQGGKMLFADPLSNKSMWSHRGMAGPKHPVQDCDITKTLTGIFYKRESEDKVICMLEKTLQEHRRYYINEGNPKHLLASSITKGKLSTSGDSSEAFHIGVEDVNKVVDLCRMLIKQEKQFIAVLIPISVVVGEIVRLENNDHERIYEPELINAVEKLSRIILACARHGNVVDII
jgi:hypothetical protein